MTADDQQKDKVSFGVFELDLASGELRKGGTKVRLQDQPFQVLRTLLERPGEVVTREELQQRLWPDETYVDFEDGISTAVRKVRAALGDSATSPRFVETLPKRGYRFVAPVSRPAAPPVGAADQQSNTRLLFVVAALALVGLGLVLAFSPSSEPGVSGPVRKFALAPGEDVHDPVISPDGRYVAFTKSEGEGGLWIQALTEETPRRISGSEGAALPFWSPDSRYIGFGTGSDLKRVALAPGSEPSVIAPTPRGRFSGAAWSAQDDRIYLTVGSVPASGGQVERFIDPADDNDSFRLVGTTDIVSLPTPGRRLLLARSQDGLRGRVRQGTHLRDLDRRESRWLLGGRSAVYSPTGHIIYQVDTATPQLHAVAFSLETLVTTGEPFVIAQDASSPSVADDGTLVYLSGAASSMRLVRRDRSGEMSGPPSAPLRTPRFMDLSPSGDAVAFTALVNEQREIWTLKLDALEAEPRRLTFNDSLEGIMLWSPDGGRILYRDTGSDRVRLVVHSLEDGTIHDLPADGIPADWRGAGDTEYLTFHGTEGLEYGKARADGDFEFAAFGVDGYYSQITHDGRFIAYGTGHPDDPRFEVRTFPGGQGPWQITLPGEQMDWLRAHPSKNEIFYSADGYLNSVEYETEPIFRITKRNRLFQLRGRYYDVIPDGDTFVLMEPLEDDQPTLRVTQNWFAEFREP